LPGKRTGVAPADLDWGVVLPSGKEKGLRMQAFVSGQHAAESWFGTEGAVHTLLNSITVQIASGNDTKKN